MTAVEIKKSAVQTATDLKNKAMNKFDSLIWVMQTLPYFYTFGGIKQIKCCFHNSKEIIGFYGVWLLLSYVYWMINLMSGSCIVILTIGY